MAVLVAVLVVVVLNIHLQRGWCFDLSLFVEHFHLNAALLEQFEAHSYRCRVLVLAHVLAHVRQIGHQMGWDWEKKVCYY